MLHIYFGDMPDAIYNTSVYFNNTYKDSWITDQMTKDMIKAVDNSDVIDAKTIMSPIFGNMSPKKLSNGVKTLILISFDRKKYSMHPHAGITARSGYCGWRKNAKL